MPASVEFSSVLERQLLLQLGQRLKAARHSKGLTSTQVAAAAGLSRMTLNAIESGEPSPTMGSYVRVMGALGFGADLALLANPAPPRHESQKTAVLEDTRVSLSRHQLQDLQSLALHQEAVRLVKRDDQLRLKALQTLDNWRSKPGSRSSPLWDEWSVVLHRKQWRRVLANTQRSNELRQASPMLSVLPEQVRMKVLDDIKSLKSPTIS
jgi:transcriptional regulator with XRE-family HTH domain